MRTCNICGEEHWDSYVETCCGERLPDVGLFSQQTQQALMLANDLPAKTSESSNIDVRPVWKNLLDWALLFTVVASVIAGWRMLETSTDNASITTFYVGLFLCGCGIPLIIPIAYKSVEHTPRKILPIVSLALLLTVPVFCWLAKPDEKPLPCSICRHEHDANDRAACAKFVTLEKDFIKIKQIAAEYYKNDPYWLRRSPHGIVVPEGHCLRCGYATFEDRLHYLDCASNKRRNYEDGWVDGIYGGRKELDRNSYPKLELYVTRRRTR